MVNLFEFMSSLFEVRGAFTSNLKNIMGLLSSQEVGFLMVTTAAPDLEKEVKLFLQALKGRSLHFDGIALNRTIGHLKDLEGKIGQDSQMGAAIELVRALQVRENAVIKTLEDNQDKLVAKLPELSRDVHSVEDLFHVALAFDSDQLHSA